MMLTTSLALPPAGTGDCTMTRHYDEATGEHTLTIDHADPRILISRDLLQETFAHPWHSRVTLADPIPSRDTYLGAALRIDGANCTVVYRITERRDEYTYVGEWPD